MKQLRSKHPVMFRVIFIPLSPVLFLLLFILLAIAIFIFMIAAGVLALVNPQEAKIFLPEILHELSMKLRG